MKQLLFVILFIGFVQAAPPLSSLHELPPVSLSDDTDLPPVS